MERNNYIYIFGEEACGYFEEHPKEFKGKNSGEILSKFQDEGIDGAVVEYNFTDNERTIYELGIEDSDGWFEHASLKNNCKK